MVQSDRVLFEKLTPQPKKYKITTTRDRAPELSILPILQEYAGQKIKLVVYLKGEGKTLRLYKRR